eukprot:5843844-Ditylum_brightwellii.AAC.1
MTVLTIVLAIVMTVVTSTSHISHKGIDCCLMERSKQNKCVDGDKDNVVDNSVGDSDDGGDTHLTHLSQGIDCCLMERSKQNGCVDDNNEDGVDSSVDGGDKHLTHLSQGVDCCLTEGSK